MPAQNRSEVFLEVTVGNDLQELPVDLNGFLEFFDA
jgi:hypothetical protein